MTWNLFTQETGIQVEKPPARLKCHSELKGWLLDWIGKVQDSIRWMMLLTLWQARNDARESYQIEDPRSIVKKTMVGMEEWLNIHKPMLKGSDKIQEHWLTTTQDWFKAIVDGAFRMSGSKVVVV
jgi:hypothetical protein